MPRYKVTLGMMVGAIGGSESYVTPSASGATAHNLINSLIARREELLHTSVVFTGYRFSIVGEASKRRSQAYPPGSHAPIVKPAADGSGGLYMNLRANGQNSNANTKPDQARASMLVRYTYDTDRSAPRYFFAPPDIILESEPASVVLSRAPDWATRFAAFRSYLMTNGFLIYGRLRTGGYLPVPIKRWIDSDAVPNNIGIVVDSTLGGAFAEGEFVQVLSSRRKGTDRLSYNGRYFVRAVISGPGTNERTVILDGTEAGDPSSIKLPGSLQRIGHGWFNIENLEAIKATTRKRGRPFGQPVGRRLKVPSLDP